MVPVQVQGRYYYNYLTNRIAPIVAILMIRHLKCKK